MNASEQNKPNQQERVIPKLRFPEFQTALGWSWKTLDQVCTITNGKSNAQDHIENGKYPLFDRSEIIKASNDYLFDCEVVIIPGEGMKFIPKYYKGKFNLHQRAYALKDFIINGKFVYYSMLNNTTLLSKKAVQSTVLSLRLPILKNFPIIKPETEEQQKIADCLSSLDELIELQEQKLAALKQHKKGLMQQLFPSHNDLQAGSVAYPKLRFPQFRNCNGWKVVELGNFCKINPSNNGLPNNFIYIDLESVSSGKLVKKNMISLVEAPSRAQRLLENDDVIYQMVRPYQRNNYYYQSNDNNYYVASTGYAQLRKKDSGSFLFQLIHTDNFVNAVLKKCTGSNYPAINSSALSSINIAVPTILEEQQAIADCLSSLDNLISEQSEQIGRLKTHKKGLMQQLFPTIQ